MKSKIEEKIKNAREATNEMFAALDELNERLSAKIEPKFAEGEFVRTFDGYIFKVSHKTINTQKTEWLYCKNPNVTYFGNYIEESKLEKWMPKRGEYYRVNIDGVVWLCIAAYTEAERVTDFVSLRHESTYLGYNMGTLIRENFYPCTLSEIALLDSKLAEQGKRFDKEKLELVNIPKHKEPIIGEMAIFWDTNNKKAFCATLNSMINGRYSPDGNIRFDNAILFESPEQYKAFLKS